METEKKIHLLYIEDDEVDAEHAIREFKKVDASILLDVVSDGDEALVRIETLYEQSERLPHALLLDIRLPKMNGLTFLKQLRTHPQYASLLVFLITASFSSKEKLAMRDLNISGCIIKPLEHKDALNILWCVNSDPLAADLLF